MIRVDLRVEDTPELFHRLTVMMSAIKPVAVLVTMKPPATGPEVEVSFFYPEGPEQAVGLSEDLIARMANTAGFDVLASRSRRGDPGPIVGGVYEQEKEAARSSEPRRHGG